MGGSWLASPADKFGGSIADASPRANRDAVAVSAVAPAVQPSVAGLLSPGDPMFWFAVLAAGTVGLMAYSTVTVSS